MAEGKLSLPVVRSVGETSRKDLWWVQPLAVFLGFSAFIVYSTWAAFQGNHYWLAKEAPGVKYEYAANYLSPFYSPELFGDSPHALFGGKPNWWPAFVPFSAALLILPFPGLFRFTCYYYRGAYYKAFWADPLNCGVGEPRKSYWGENSWPLILQNVHRYALYFALIFIVILFWDFIQALRFQDAAGNWHFGVGVGTLVLLLNVLLLGSYTFGCHSFRHLIGGHRDELAGSPTQKKAYDCVSCLNRWHMACAWCSLFWVGFSDVYVRMCSMGVWTDFRLVF
ncbi:MAG: succinate dehydrogenase [Planctomycetes bacterium]|nr:succinate dehydrogenase [Planctomycetota bacterium]